MVRPPARASVFLMSSSSLHSTHLTVLSAGSAKVSPPQCGQVTISSRARAITSCHFDSSMRECGFLSLSWLNSSTKASLSTLGNAGQRRMTLLWMPFTGRFFGSSRS